MADLWADRHALPKQEGGHYRISAPVTATTVVASIEHGINTAFTETHVIKTTCTKYDHVFVRLL